ncbi:MAG TPA: GAF domain-containing protein [Terriglobales bacterium]|nr:GAF domain-containing protein [Terriglobales bacterium]
MNHNLAIERRHSLRHKINTPAFASFDGVTGGMILDLSEEGMAMQTMSPLEEHSRVPMHLSLGEPAIYLETTGYVAWADALGRAGVRFSDLPEESRARLREWLTSHDSTPSWKAPRWVVREQPTYRGASQNKNGNGVALSLETEPRNDHTGNGSSSTSVQYEFKSLGGDLDAALTLIVGRACSITRGTGAAVALSNETGMVCRAVAGATVLPIGTLLDVTRGFSGECIRLGKPLRCDDAELDSRVDARACRELDIRSILAAPVLYERNIVGLLEVFSTQPGAFDDGDVAVVERLSQTVVLTLSRADAMQRH